MVSTTMPCRCAPVIHYHGLPITPATAAAKVLSGRHAFISFAHPGQLEIAVEQCQSFAVDNGAFSAWRSGKPVTDWSDYYAWVESLKRSPGFDFAVVPDVIDGTEDDNDALLYEWPHERHLSAAVWHMHESIDRLIRMANEWPRIALGSSGEYAAVGDAVWWNRISEAMNSIVDHRGHPPCKLHGLRMLNPDVFTRLPFASADSTNIGQNIGIDNAWRGTYQPPSKEWRALTMAERIESHNSVASWRKTSWQPSLLTGEKQS